MYFNAFSEQHSSHTPQHSPLGEQHNPAGETAAAPRQACSAQRIRQDCIETARSAAPPARFRRRALELAVSSVLGSGLAFAGGAVAQNEEQATAVGPLVMETVEVTGFRGERMNSSRYTRDLLNTPRLISVLPSDLLEEQNVTSLRDAMRNVPGISLQAGEGNPPGGDQLKIRGFNARDDIKVDGIRDMGNYFRDPFYVEQLEVVKGPNSTITGRGSPGGTINFVTKKPSLEPSSRVELSAGTDDYQRVTADINQPIDDNSAFRLNLLGHAADIPGRDVVNDKRWGMFGAYTWGFTGDTLLSVDWLHTEQDNIEDKGLPFDREGFTGPKALCDQPDNDRVGRVGNQRCGDGFATGEIPDEVEFSDFFGHVDDTQDIEVDIFTAGVQHAFSSSVQFPESVPLHARETMTPSHLRRASKYRRNSGAPVTSRSPWYRVISSLGIRRMRAISIRQI